MTELTVTHGSAKGSRIALSSDESCSIGSAADSTLALTDSGVEPTHAVVKALKGGGFGIKSLAAGVLVNGREIEAARLADGDTIDIGRARVVFGPAAVRKPKPAAAEPPAAAPPPPAAERPPSEPAPAARAASSGGPLKAGHMIGGFKLIGTLGKGGMGMVYRAEQVSLHREVALKVLSTKLTRDPVFVARFVAEARAAARLHHPNVVQVFDVDHEGETYFYSMELMAQGSVEDLLKAHGKLPVEQALAIVTDAAKGLAYAEELRIVHRDIKPDNLMLDQHGHAKIVDLGLALTDEDDSGKVVGTPHFMAPEQALRKPVDHRTDLYALGCTFYRAVTGSNPFQKSSVKEILAAHVKEDAVPAHKRNADVPVEVSAIIAQLMAKDPADRYQSAADLYAELEALAAPPSRRGVVIGAIAAAVVVVVSAIIWVATRPEPGERIITKTVMDPRADELEEQMRVREAENALLKVQVKGLTGLALAAELEAMAAKYPNTAAAERASTRAKEVRDSVRRQQEAADQRQQALETARGSLRSAFDSAVAAHDYDTAARVLSGSTLAAELRDDAGVRALLETLRGELTTKAGARLEDLKAPVSRGIDERDADAIRTALGALEAVLQDEGGWPPEALADRGPLERFVADSRQIAASLDEERRAAAEQAAWGDLKRAISTDDGVLARAIRLDLAGATDGAQSIADSLSGSAAGQRIADLVPALRKANQFLERLAQTNDDTGYEVSLDAYPDDTVKVIGFSTESGFQLQIGKKIRNRTATISIADAYADLRTLTSLPADRDDPLARETFLGVVAAAMHARAALGFLTTLDPANDTSGTGPNGYTTPTAILDGSFPALEKAAGEHDWAARLREELVATRSVVRGLGALSSRRNRTAAGLLNRVLVDSADTLVVRILR